MTAAPVRKPKPKFGAAQRELTDQQFEALRPALDELARLLAAHYQRTHCVLKNHSKESQS